ncbi:interleukin-15 receptor subunit alpha isoform X3 [Moschus berezovskii]|uniref:interleukin-15 receptor subunit alpha isoform X3 n=1 Tax=Moschus berezovskii TaxID=68408 RepID=UPI002444E154|nr:interleukin-15 receptor subunit alpha isoform X3 [Moschus berezovskii]
MFLGKKDAARLRSASGSAGSGGTFGQAARAARQVWAWAHRAGDQVSRAGRQPSCHPASQARTGGARGHSFAGSPAARGPGRLSQSDSRRQARGGDRVEPKPGITCPTPTSVEHADIQVKNYSINSRERYVCNSGFKRKAGTSSLTQCVFNETAKVAHWTTPNLKCIRDPSLSHQRPPSTAAPTGLTPEPESPTPSGKEPDLTSKSDTKVATRPTTGPGSRLPSTAPPVVTTGVVSKETTSVPAQTAAKVLEHTHPALQDTHGAYQYNPRVVTAAVSTAVAVLFGVCLVSLLASPPDTRC